MKACYFFNFFVMLKRIKKRVTKENLFKMSEQHKNIQFFQKNCYIQLYLIPTENFTAFYIVNPIYQVTIYILFLA